MQVLHGLDGLRRLSAGAVVSVGNFDGVHLGHQEIVRRAKGLRDGTAGARLAVVTFEPHPMTVLKPELAPPRLTPPSLKQELMRAAGVDDYVVLPPEPAVLNLTAEDFWKVIRDEVKPSHMVEGQSFNFGRGRTGTIDQLREWAAASAVKLTIVDPVEVALLDFTVVPVSSSFIRWLLARGRVRDAAISMGRTYVLEGEVVRGHQRGRAIRVPTANLRCDGQLVPGEGVYVGRCAVDGVAYGAAVSIGTMPTFGENQRQVEVHLIGFAGNLYGRRLSVEVVDWVREQTKFKSIDALKEQLGRDIEYCAERSGLDAARPTARVR
jgi:riboflavin kinase / FMN adenylyltransferase